MTRTVSIFGGATTVTVPDDFSQPDDENTKSTDAKSRSTLLFTYQDDPDTHIRGGISERQWDDAAVEELLNTYAGVLTRSLPAVQIVQMATRQTTNGLHGIIQYTYATPDKDWMGTLVAFPAQEHVGVLFMTCSMDHAFERSQQFIDIAESLAPNATTEFEPETDDAEGEPSPTPIQASKTGPNWSQWQH